MCTMISSQVKIDGSGKVRDDWYPLTHVVVSYDHPYHNPSEYCLNIDFTNVSQGPALRVAVELDAVSARILVKTISDVLERAQRGGFLDSSEK
jgi:hypothetical protein